MQEIKQYDAKAIQEHEPKILHSLRHKKGRPLPPYSFLNLKLYLLLKQEAYGDHILKLRPVYDVLVINNLKAHCRAKPIIYLQH